MEKNVIYMYERVEKILSGNDMQYNRLPRLQKIGYLKNVRDYVVTYQRENTENVVTVQQQIPTVQEKIAQKQKIYTNQNRLSDNRAA